MSDVSVRINGVTHAALAALQQRTWCMERYCVAEASKWPGFPLGEVVKGEVDCMACIAKEEPPFWSMVERVIEDNSVKDIQDTVDAEFAAAFNADAIVTIDGVQHLQDGQGYAGGRTRCHLSYQHDGNVENDKFELGPLGISGYGNADCMACVATRKQKT